MSKFKAPVVVLLALVAISSAGSNTQRYLPPNTPPAPDLSSLEFAPDAACTRLLRDAPAAPTGFCLQSWPSPLYSGMGAYSLAPSLAAAPPNLPVLSGNFSFGWSGLYSSALALPSGEAQIQLQVTLGDTQGRGTQSCIARAWVDKRLLIEALKPEEPKPSANPSPPLNFVGPLVNVTGGDRVRLLVAVSCSSYFPSMTGRLFINGIIASPLSLSPAPPSAAFFVNVFEFESGNWLGTVPAPSSDAIPLSLLPLSNSSSQSFRFQISAVLSSLQPVPWFASFAANSSLSPQVFLDGIAVQASANNVWNLTESTQRRPALLRIELSGSLSALTFSITCHSNVSMLPVIINGILFTSSSVRAGATKATFVAPSVASLQSINSVWGGSDRVLDASVLHNITLSFMWQLPLRASSISQIRITTSSANVVSVDPMYMSVYLNSVYLQPVKVDLNSRVFNVEGLMQQSSFADFYMSFDAQGHPPVFNIEYSDGSTWNAVPVAAMRPLSCSPGISVFAGQSGLPLLHSCLCPLDRQIALQPMCRSVRRWSCSIALDLPSTCSVAPLPSSLFNAVPPCAEWKDGSNKVAVNLACQFLRVAGGSSAIFDPGNFSYAFAIKRKGDADYFGLTVDPEIYLNAYAVELNTGDQTPLGSVAVASSDSALMTVALTNGFKAPSFGGRVYTEAVVAPSRDLYLEQGEVVGISIVAFDVANAAGTVSLFCKQSGLLVLLMWFAA